MHIARSILTGESSFSRFSWVCLVESSYSALELTLFHGMLCRVERYDWKPGVTAHPMGVRMSVRIASCSCGQLQAEVRGEPIGVSVCHCYACQRRTGSVFGEQAGFPRGSVATEGDGPEFVRVVDERGRLGFFSVPDAGRPSSTSTKRTKDESPSPPGPSRTLAFPH